MRLLIINFLLLFAFASTAQVSVDALQKVAVKINSIDPTNANYYDLEFLKETLKSKKIIILGETGHGDGASFEAKTRIIKFLHEQMNFNTIAFEGGGFFDMYYANLTINSGTDFKEALSKSWFQLWSKSAQTQELINYMEKNPSLQFIGIENQAGNEYWLRFPDVLKTLIGEDIFQNVDFNSFKENQLSFYFINVLGNTGYNNTFDIGVFKAQLNTLYQNTSLINSEHKDYMLQSIRNIQGFITHLELNSGSYEEQNKGIRMRDSLMYENLKFFIDRNPEEKIIIWTANFHGAKNIHQAQYKEGDDFYQMMKTLGHHIYEDYQEELYSLAFVSSGGTTATIYEADTKLIELDDSCWENEMEKHLMHDYSFIDFELLKENHNSDLRFNSCVLGYSSKLGNWFNIFDGIFYIKTMKRSVYSDDNGK